EVNPKVPTMLRWIIERCLAKDPADRYASSADLHKDLVRLQERYSEITSEDNRAITAAPAPRRRAMMIGLVAAAALTIAAVTAWSFSGNPPAPSAHFSPFVTEGGFQGSPAWSHDGK